MDRRLKWGVVAVFVALALWLAYPAYIWLASEAVIDQRYTLPRSLVEADQTPEGTARGRRLVILTGCAGCHGEYLSGKQMRDGAFPIYASNLRALVKVYDDEDFDRAIRRGLRPDASSLWVMPSQSYVYMHDSDVASILGYLRSLPATGRRALRPLFSWTVRKKIAIGQIEPAAPLALVQMPAIALGARYDGGRYIAMIACGSCHGGDLSGTDIAPDLNVIKRYSREQFFNLMRKGRGANARKLRMMRPLAQRFHLLEDWEIDPLYAYLGARSNAPTMEEITNAIE